LHSFQTLPNFSWSCLNHFTLVPAMCLPCSQEQRQQWVRISLLNFCHYDRWEVVPQLFLVYLFLLISEVHMCKICTTDIPVLDNCSFLLYIFYYFYILLQFVKLVANNFSRRCLLPFYNFVMQKCGFFCHRAIYLWIFES
jgi:hypothetical protein